MPAQSARDRDTERGVIHGAEIHAAYLLFGSARIAHLNQANGKGQAALSPPPCLSLPLSLARSRVCVCVRIALEVRAACTAQRRCDSARRSVSWNTGTEGAAAAGTGAVPSLAEIGL